MALLENLTHEFIRLVPEDQYALILRARRARELNAEAARTKRKRGGGKKGTPRVKRTTSKADRISQTLKLLKTLPKAEREALMKEMGIL